jgi:hypothetical protein
MLEAEIQELSQLTGQSRAAIRRGWREWRRLEMAAQNPRAWVILREPNGDLRAVEKDFANAVARANRRYERLC